MIDLKNIKIQKKKQFIKNINLETGNLSLRLYSSKIFGSGIFSVSITKDGRTIYDFKFVSQSASQFLKDISISDRGLYSISIYTNYHSEILINRLILNKHESSKNKVTTKKIACIIPYSIYGGAEIYLKNIIESAENYNITWDLIYIQKNPLENLLNLNNVRHVNCLHFNNFGNYLLSNKYDFIFFYNSKQVYNKICSTKVYNSSKLVQIYHSDLKWADSIEQSGNLDFVDYTIKISDFVGTHIPNYLLIKPIINTKKFVEILGNRNVIGTVARFSNEKNLEYIIKIAKILKQHNFVIYGEGRLKSHFIYKMKQENVTNIKVESFKTDIYNYYNNFGLFLLTSKIEGIPLTVIEAMSCNIPVIAPKVGGLSELIEGGLVDELTMNPSCDSEKIKKIFGKKVETRNYVLANHSFEAYKKSFEKLLQDANISVRERNLMEKELEFYYV